MTDFRTTAFLHAAVALIVAGLASTADASELIALGGAMKANSPSEDSYSWQLEYRQDLHKHLGAGFSYLNEGHVDGHRRDGYTSQIWVRSELLDNRLTLAAAAGPYFYLDTARALNAKGFTNDHGFKAMYSVAAAWHLQNDLILEVRSNWVAMGSSYNTTSVLAGIGYHFDPNLEPKKGKEFENDPKNEITGFLGQTIVNSYDSETATTGALEYRHRFLRHLDWTVSNIYEGNDQLPRRDGLVTQVWANQDLLEGLLTAGVGIGPYFEISRYHNSLHEDNQRVACMLTLSGSYRFSQHWALRISWNRLVTGNDFDSDLILGGLGYRF